MYQNGRMTISSIEELEKFLLQIRQNSDPPNQAFDMVHRNGNTLVLSISPDGCFVYYMDVSGEPYYSSLGDNTLPKRPGEAGSVAFFYGGHISYIPKRNIISFESLLEVAKEFFITGNRPEGVIEWEADN
jgi:hypothetical protein